MGFMEGRRLAVGYGAIAGLCFGFFGWLNVKYPATYTLLWPGAVYSWVALSYVVNEPRLIGLKDRDTGYLNKFVVVAMLPFYALVWAVWYTRKVLHGASDPSSQHIIGRWYIGRQPLGLQDLPPDTGLVVDLTAEFGRLYSLRKGGLNYLCIPSLDTSPPALSDRAHFAKCLKEAAFFSSGNVFVHCANGHGRSAAFLVGMMVMTNVVPSISEGEKLLKSIRPTIKIRAGQKKFLEEVLATEGEARPPGGTRGMEISASESPSPSSSATELLDKNDRASSSSSSENLQISTASSSTSSPETNPSSSRRRLSGASLPSNNDRNSSK